MIGLTFYLKSWERCVYRMPFFRKHSRTLCWEYWTWTDEWRWCCLSVFGRAMRRPFSINCSYFILPTFETICCMAGRLMRRSVLWLVELWERLLRLLSEHDVQANTVNGYFYKSYFRFWSLSLFLETLEYVKVPAWMDCRQIIHGPCFVIN